MTRHRGLDFHGHGRGCDHGYRRAAKTGNDDCHPHGSGCSDASRGGCNASPCEDGRGTVYAFDGGQDSLVHICRSGHWMDNTQGIDKVASAPESDVALVAGEEMGLKPSTLGRGELVVNVGGGHFASVGAFEGLYAARTRNGLEYSLAEIGGRGLGARGSQRPAEQKQTGSQTGADVAPLQMCLALLQADAVKLAVYIRLNVLG